MRGSRVVSRDLRHRTSLRNLAYVSRIPRGPVMVRWRSVLRIKNDKLPIVSKRRTAAYIVRFRCNCTIQTDEMERRDDQDEQQHDGRMADRIPGPRGCRGDRHERL